MATPYRLKRTAVSGRRPTALDKGELAFNFHDGHLFAERDTAGVGIGTTIALLTPWQEAYGGGAINYTGIVTATSFSGEGGNLTLGTPSAGSFRGGAFTLTSNHRVDNSIEELNFILGKLVPPAPTNISGVSLSLTGTAGNARLCAGFTPTNNSGAAAPVAGTLYARNTDSTITTNYITEYGPGDSGTVEGFVNATGIGSTAMNVSFGVAAVKSDNGTYGALQIANDKDAANSSRDTGIDALFYEVYDARIINAASPDGYNKAHISQLGNNTANVFWYEDPSTVTAPVIAFAGAAAPNPASHVIANSSSIPHYQNNANNNFTYNVTVTNASGDMYTTNDFVTTPGGATAVFNDLGNFNYTNFTDGNGAGANPPVRNFGVGGAAPAVAAVTQTIRDLHASATTGYFSLFTASTPYGTHSNQRPADLGGVGGINIMGTTARTTVIDEDNILISSLGTGSGNATRVNAGAAADNPAAIFTAFNAGATLNAQEAAVRGGVLRHDQTNYTTWLPAGPNLSTGRNGAQYFQLEIIRSNISQFNISVTGTYGGCWVCMPNNATWTGSLGGTNGWADMFTAYRGAGVPTTAEPGCATGGNMAGNSGTFTCTFGTESSSNDSNNRILVRWKLDAGDSITAMSFS